MEGETTRGGTRSVEQLIPPAGGAQEFWGTPGFSKKSTLCPKRDNLLSTAHSGVIQVPTYTKGATVTGLLVLDDPRDPFDMPRPDVRRPLETPEPDPVLLPSPRSSMFLSRRTP